MFHQSIPTEEDVREWVEGYRYSNVGKIVWTFTYGDWTNYPSKFGKLFTEIKTVGKMRDNVYSTTVPLQKALLEKGIAYHDIIAEHLHSMGIKFDMMIRPSIQRNPLDVVDGFMEKHLELRIRHRDGSPVEKLSFAYPEVRDFQLAIMREATERFDLDGVNIAFVRLNLCMGWEKPVVDAIRAQYGDVEPTEEQRRTVSAQFLVQFMRDARQVLDDVGRKKNKRLELSVWVWPWDDGYSPQFHVDYRSMM